MIDEKQCIMDENEKGKVRYIGVTLYFQHDLYSSVDLQNRWTFPHFGESLCN